MNSKTKDLLLLPTEGDLLFLDVSQIVRIKAVSNYCRLYFSDRRFPLTVAKTLSWLEHQQVLSSFIRIHRSHLVNPLHIKCFRNKKSLLMLLNDETFPVARRRRQFLNKKLNDLSINNQLLPFKLLTNKTIAA